MLVPLSAADNTTNAMSTITHTETTKAKITVFDSSEGNVMRVEIADLKKRAAIETAAQKREKIARLHSARTTAHVSIGLTGIVVLVSAKTMKTSVFTAWKSPIPADCKLQFVWRLTPRKRTSTEGDYGFVPLTHSGSVTIFPNASATRSRITSSRSIRAPRASSSMPLVASHSASRNDLSSVCVPLPESV
jgi:hypothetical protein